MKMSDTVLTNNLKRQYSLYADEYKRKACEVLESGWYVLGHELESFEREWAEYIGAQHCIGVASGLDALTIGCKLIGIGEGDEVIVASNAYIACIMGITKNGGTPIFVEPNGQYNIDASKIEAAITPKTKAIMAVHLFGQCCDMDAIVDIANNHELKVIEDCAQSHGNNWRGRKAGSFGDVACFSFYPSKGCGAFGDGGAIVTNDSEIDRQARIIRNYGSEERYKNSVVGMNSRLDEMQAGLLRVKLSHLDELNEERNRLASRYGTEIVNPRISKPLIAEGADSSWHQYVIRASGRDRLKGYLEEKGISSIIHYPIPPHLSEAYAYLGYKKGDFPIAERYADEVLSIPIYNGMTYDEQTRVIDALNEFK